MNNTQLSPAYLRKRKMMLALPLLVLPFLTMGFWALGGGSGSDSTGAVNNPGLNLNLPEAKLKEDGKADKLSFYDRADKDSVKRGDYRRSDPYFNVNSPLDAPAANDVESLANETGIKQEQSLNPSPYQSSSNATEQQLMQRLAQLQKQLDKPADDAKEMESNAKQPPAENGLSGDVDRLAGMMQDMQDGEGEDAGLKQIGFTLDKILDIQHPERVKERTKPKPDLFKQPTVRIQKQSTDDVVGLLDTPKLRTRKSNGFYGLEEVDKGQEHDNALEAIVTSNQVLVDGSIVQLRTATDVFLNGTLIPKGTSVSGIAKLNGERLEASIQCIRSGNSLYTVNLELYDMDGLPGINIPGSISRDVAKQSADNSLHMMEMASLDPSLKAQAAAAGLSTARNLLSRKVKQVKVMVKAGYRVLLRSKDASNN